MFKTISSIIVLGILGVTFPVYAIDAPTLISPANNSTVTSIPTFTWQAVAGATGYNILIDDEPTVTSPYVKSPYYPTNPSYSPKTLNPGTYYWKVKAKDSSGVYGNFSSVWSFTFPSTPSPSSTPTPISSPTPPPTSSPSSQSPTSSFTISNTPSQISADQSFTVSVSLSSPSSPNTTFYLKGAFKKADSSNYFGLTKVSGNWVKNGTSFANQYAITTDSSGNWSGNLEVRPDTDDSGFVGSSDYIFKVGRYTSAGLGPAWSNESIINIVNTVSAEGSDQGGAVSEAPSNNPSSATTSPPPSPSAKSKTTISRVYQTASVAAASARSEEATVSASPPLTAEVKSQKKMNYLRWAGTLMIVGGISVLVFVYLRHTNLPHAISNLFRKRN